MGDGNFSLRLLQGGVESTPGTPVAATFQFVGEAVQTEHIGRVFEDNPRQVRADVTGGGDIVEQETTIEVTQPLSYEDIMIPLATGISAPDTSGTDPYVHVFTPPLTTQAAPKSLTMEYSINDGATAHYSRECAFMTCSKLALNMRDGELVETIASYFGRPSTDAAVTAALTPLAGRTKVAGGTVAIYIDDAQSGLGGTQKLGFLDDATLEFEMGVMPKRTLDGRTDLGMSGLDFPNHRANLRLTVRHNADAAAELAKWRTGATRFVRLTATDGTKIIEFDLAMIYREDPDKGHDDNRETITINLVSEYDPTSASLYVATVTNSLETLPA